MEERLTKEDYNKEPVYYCKGCLSLKVKTVAAAVLDLDYCDDCGSTDIEQSSIEEWDYMYEKRYGFKYLNNNF